MKSYICSFTSFLIIFFVQKSVSLQNCTSFQPKCDLVLWSEWGNCESTNMCGHGIQRRYKNQCCTVEESAFCQYSCKLAKINYTETRICHKQCTGKKTQRGSRKENKHEEIRPKRSSASQKDCERAVDFFFLVDSSGSVGETNFNQMKGFLKSFVHFVTIGKNDSQVGITTYNKNVTLRIRLNSYSNESELTEAIEKIKYDGGHYTHQHLFWHSRSRRSQRHTHYNGTMTGKGLQWINQNAFNATYGGRDKAKHVLIVMTDGESSDNTAVLKEAKILHSQGIIVYSIGIGNSLKETELGAIASDASHKIIIKNFNDLKALTTNVIGTACSKNDTLVHRSTRGVPTQKSQTTLVQTTKATTMLHSPSLSVSSNKQTVQVKRPSSFHNQALTKQPAMMANSTPLEHTTADGAAQAVPGSVKQHTTSTMATNGDLNNSSSKIQLTTATAQYLTKQTMSKGTGLLPNGKQPAGTTNRVIQMRTMTKAVRQMSTKSLIKTQRIDNVDPKVLFCRDSKCKNGTCVPLVSDYLCLCQSGYIGKYCEIDKDDCETEPCVYGKCFDEIDGYHCQCSQLFHGKNCDKMKLLSIMVIIISITVVLLTMCCCFWLLSGGQRQKDERDDRNRKLLPNKSIFSKMAHINGPLKIGLRVEHCGSMYKIVNYLIQPNSVRQYVIQSMNTGEIKTVFRHQICDESAASLFSQMTDRTIFQFENELSQSDDEMADMEQVAPPVESKKKPRFKDTPTEVEVQQLAQARLEPKTIKQTSWGVKLFREWLSENDHDAEFETLDDGTLNTRLGYFYASLQTKQGTDYSKSALVGIRAAISRHLNNPPYNRPVSLMLDRSFMTSNNILTGLIKKQKREGKDVTQHKKAIADGDIQKLYSSGVFAIDKPETLQNKIFWDIMFNFGRRGQEGLHDLKKSSYVKFTDDKGLKYYKIAYNETNKTHHGIDSREKCQDVRMYEKPGDDNCPVKSLDLYLSKLSPKCQALFQQPLQFPKQTVWYAAQPVGKNKLATMMSKLSDNAKLSVRYTNHCIRATVATGLKRAGVDNLAIMSVTGHRNEQSLNSYIEGPTAQQQRELSTTLHTLSTASESEPVVVHAPKEAVNSAVSNIQSNLIANRNPLSDLHLFTNAIVHGGTININVVSEK